MPAAQAESAPAGVAPPLAPTPTDPPPRRPAVRPVAVPSGLWLTTLLTAGLFCFITFYAKGGLNLESMTNTELVLTLGAGAIVAAAVLLTPAGRRTHGLWPLGLLLAFAVLTVLSSVWSVKPDDSWRDAGRMLAFSGVFGAAIVLARLAPERWPSVLGGLTLAAVIVCGFALLTKIFPGDLVPPSSYARLAEPYGYWNAVGLTAAIGMVGCLWLGARRAGHALLNALAYPAMGLLLLTLLLAYSRGALAALAVGLVLWFCMMPLRLRSAAVLLPAVVVGGGLGAWAFSRDALSSENVPLAERASGGHQLGVLLAAMLLLLMLAGVAVGFLTGRRAPSLTARRNAGATLLALLVFALAAFAGALASTDRGFTGSISHAVDSVTNPNAKPPPNTPDRLTGVASVRARYWKEALQIFDAHPALGAGAAAYQTARMRYRKETLEVRHAHGYVVQTLADLGLVGLVLSLAVLLSWMAAAGRPTHPFNRRWRSWSAWRRIREGARPGWERSPEPYSPERIGLLSMLTLVVVFGTHSLIDWTWYVPGDACAALLCAGWLAGRGPLAATLPGRAPARPASGEGARRPRGRQPLLEALERLGYPRVAVAGAVIVAALLAAWAQWQPQRSEEARQQALAMLARDPRAAADAAHAAVSRDPLSAEALLTLANVQEVRGERGLARSTLQKAVRLQPSNPQTWLALGRYDLTRDPRAALQELQAAIYLNPQSVSPEALAKERDAVEIHNDYVLALRAASRAQGPASNASAAPAPAAPAAHPGGRRRTAPRSPRSRSPRAVR